MKFKPNDIVYFVERSKRYNFEYIIAFGIVIEEFSDAVCIERITFSENRYVDGVPYKNIPEFGKWQKLPKGWSYDTKLFNLEYIRTKEELEQLQTLRIDKPEDIKKGLESGILIPMHLKDQSVPHSEIDKKYGWRLYKEHATGLTYQYPYVSLVNKELIYFTHEEAKRELQSIKDEMLRQSKLSDEEWSKEEISKTIDKWVTVTQPSPEEKQKVIDFLFNLKNIDKVETRFYMGNIQWKYEDRKRWVSICFN